MTKAEKVAQQFSELQEYMCSILEKADEKAKFSKDRWTKNIGGGLTRVMQNGNAIEKGAINFSHVKGDFTPQMSQILGEQGSVYEATGISSILHSHNPLMPTIHMNVRYFSIDNKTEWFGGGIDLTPMYIDVPEAKTFHQSIKAICDKYAPEFYPNYKKWADDYFFIPHREETRGIGGIFFDRLKPSEAVNFDQLFQFACDLAQAYPNIYANIIQNKAHLPFNSKQKEWQLIRRGRYVEFNLVYDRGTKFGLETGGNTESILVSLPVEVKWEYNHILEDETPEKETLKLLKKGIDWV